MLKKLYEIMKEYENITITREQFFECIRTPKDRDGHISKETQHYLNYFDKYQKTKSYINWNWSAALSQNFWFFYRKMYLNALVLNTIQKLLRTIVTWAVKPYNLSQKWEIPLDIFEYLVAGMLVGLFSDYYYLFFAHRKVKKGVLHKGTHKPWIIVSLFILFCLLLAMLFKDQPHYLDKLFNRRF